MKALAIALVLLSITLVGCDESAGSGADIATSSGSRAATTEASGGGSENPGEATTSEPRIVTINASGGERVEVRVEIADDLSEQSRGLMYRTALAEDRGMLFVYPDEEELSFWMKNTLIPLSIAFIDSEGRIVDIQDMKPLDDDPPHYVSAEPAQYALEVNEGFFEERGVEVGDRANLPV
jgi:uncharacterized membrane protein (UPF0127 family)/predicted small secreted protein